MYKTEAQDSSIPLIIYTTIYGPTPPYRNSQHAFGGGVFEDC